jgi:hypothetical protein
MGGPSNSTIYFLSLTAWQLSVRWRIAMLEEPIIGPNFKHPCMTSFMQPHQYFYINKPSLLLCLQWTNNISHSVSIFITCVLFWITASFSICHFSSILPKLSWHSECLDFFTDCATCFTGWCYFTCALS